MDLVAETDPALHGSMKFTLRESPCFWASWQYLIVVITEQDGAADKLYDKIVFFWT